MGALTCCGSVAACDLRQPRCCVEVVRAWLTGVSRDQMASTSSVKAADSRCLGFVPLRVRSGRGADLNEGVTGSDHAGRAKPFETTHRPQPGLESSVVGFDGVIGVLLGDVASSGEKLVEHARVGGCSVGWLGANTPLDGDN
jgi:hypothetical protein